MANQKPFPPIGREGVLKHCKEALYTRYLSFVVDRFVTYCMNAHDHHHQRGEATSTQCFLYDCMLLFVRKPTILIVAAVCDRIWYLNYHVFEKIGSEIHPSWSGLVWCGVLCSAS